MEEMVLGRLWRYFWLTISLPLLLFLTVAVMHRMAMRIIPPGSIRIWGIWLFIAATSFAVAFPVLLRIFFHGKCIKGNAVTILEYIAYQKKLFILCSLAMVPASLAYLFIVSPLYMYGSVLAALYGIYSTIPIKDKISKELVMYKIER